MTYGFRAVNTNGVVTIDEKSKTYAYLGVYAIDDQSLHTSIDVDCVGFPFIYFSLPYGRSDRAGIAQTGLHSIGVNRWRISFTVYNPSSAALGLQCRVFGRTDLNFAGGSGNPWGFFLFTPAGELLFDSNLPMHKLAGNTYSYELTLTAQVPTGADSPTKYDASFVMPFDLAGKSLCANTRGIVRYPEYWGGYQDWDTGQWIDQYQIRKFETVFYAQGAQLIAARVYEFDGIVEVTTPLTVDFSKLQTVYSRVAFIQNNRF